MVGGLKSLEASTLATSAGIVDLLLVFHLERRRLRRRGAAAVAARVAWMLSGVRHLRSGASSSCELRAECVRLLYAFALFGASRLGVQCTADWLTLHMVMAILDVAVGTCCGLCRPWYCVRSYALCLVNSDSTFYSMAAPWHDNGLTVDSCSTGIVGTVSFVGLYLIGIVAFVGLYLIGIVACARFVLMI